MAISPAARPGRRLTRWVLRVLLLAAAMLAVATPALAAGHAANHDRSAHNYRTDQVAAAPATLTASLTPAAPQQPGGVCQVPGIGDIGGLVGLCNQGSSGIVGDLNNICQPSLPQP
jgi:hypothetical protein